MKKFIFMVVCLLGMAATASAQFANSKGSASSSDMSGWQGMRISYHPMSIVHNVNDDKNFTGLSVGYAKGFAVSQGTPLFLEVTPSVLWSSYSDDNDYTSTKLNMFSINVPVNFGYKHALSENVSIFPYVGINFRVNIVGTQKEESEYGDDDESYDIFSKEKMGKDPFKRFQAGWQIGIACNINNFMMAASYGKDFSEIQKKAKFSMPSLTVGYNF